MAVVRSHPPLAAATQLAMVMALALGPGGLRRAGAADGDASGVTALGRLFEGLPHRLVIADPLAYVGLDTGLAIFDVSDPRYPVRLGHVYLPSPAFDLALSGNHIFTANGESGLAVIDISDPTRPSRIGVLATAGTRAVAFAGSIAYLGEASAGPGAAVNGLRVVDVSNPAAPTALGFLSLPNGAISVAVTGTTVWVGTGNDRSGVHGLYAVDVTDPQSPAAVAGGFLASARPVNRIALAGGLAYLATGLPSSGGLLVADLSNRAAPALISTTSIADGVRDVALSPGLALVAAGTLGLASYDVSNPAQPLHLDTLRTDRETVAVAVRGNVFFLGERSSNREAALTAVDGIDPGWLRDIATVPYAEAMAAATSGVLALLLRRDGLHVFDGSGPALTWLSTWSPPGGDYSALAALGSLAAVTEGPRVHLVDLSDPLRPAARATIRISLGNALRVVLTPSTLYAVTGFGLESFDVSSPSAPAPLGTFLTPGWSSALALAQPYGYLAAGPAVHVLDLSFPAQPQEVSSFIPDANDSLYAVAAAGPLLVATGLVSTLHVIDVTDPRAARRLATYPGPTGFDVALSATSAVVAAAEAGLLVIDLSQPASPLLTGYYDTSGTATALAIDRDRVYLATVAAQHWLLSCAVCVPTCSEQWPTIAVNSLRMVKGATADRLAWAIASGSGASNLHQTLDKRQLPSLPSLPASLIATTSAVSHDDAFDPPLGQTAHYRVFGRGSCTGNSYP